MLLHEMPGVADDQRHAVLLGQLNQPACFGGVEHHRFLDQQREPVFQHVFGDIKM